jgi:hypothetical protein
MGIISNLFSKPRLYDDNWQMESRDINVYSTGYDWIVPYDYNIQLLAVHITATTVAGIRNATDHFRIDFLDGGRKIFQAYTYNLASSLTYKLTFQAGMGLTQGFTTVDARLAPMPDFLFLTPGQIVSLTMNNPLAGDVIQIMNITYKRWKL